jgi:nucleotide-binding universal stress UspA family protein
MSRTVSNSTALAVPALTRFRSILCGVDGSPAAAEAARQAAILSTAGARLRLLGVGWEEPQRRWARATSEPHRLSAALETARLEARSLGVAPAVRLVESREAARVLLTHAADSDLLVLGAGGGTATAAVLWAPVPVLLARRPPDGVAFPSSIVAVTDGTPASAGVAAAAAQLASAHGARVSVVDEHAAAASVGAALVVIGAASDRFVVEARCSVLVLRPRASARFASVGRRSLPDEP